MAEQISTNEKATPKRAVKHNLRFKLISLIAGGLIILMSVTLGVVLLYNHLHKASQQNNTNQSKNSIDLSKFTPEQKANYYILQQDYSKAKMVYLSQLDAAKTKDEKADAYGSLAVLALDAHDYSQALDYAKKAEEFSPTYATAKTIGYVAQLKGDKQTARQYYQLAIDRLVQLNQPNADRAISSIRADLKEVQ